MTWANRMSSLCPVFMKGRQNLFFYIVASNTLLCLASLNVVLHTTLLLALITDAVSLLTFC